MSEDFKIWTTFISSGLALVGVIYTAIMNYISRSEQDQFKQKAEEDLTYLKDKLEIEREKRLKLFEFSLTKIANLEESRNAGYGEIWTLTGSLNLFGPKTEPDIKDISTRFTDWYFKYGLLLKKESQRRYFLIQEVLTFAIFKSMLFKSPSPDMLFYKKDRPVSVLDDLRIQYLGSSDNKGDIEKLESFVTKWKMKSTERKIEDEGNWILLQLLLSRFRSHLIKELGLSDNQDIE